MSNKVIMKINNEVIFGTVDVDLSECIKNGETFRMNDPYALYSTEEGVSPMPYEGYAVMDPMKSVSFQAKDVLWFTDLDECKQIRDAYLQLTTSIIQEPQQAIVI